MKSVLIAIAFGVAVKKKQLSSASVAQQDSQQLPLKEKVVGSSPTGGTK